ncbi:MAG: hypothetical protein RJA98_3829 [Pseudomonadota bacterium]|jgi:hypothetical protein
MPLSTAAAAVTIGLHLATAHFGGAPNSPHVENVTPGLYLRTASGITAGIYSNSEGGTSAYAGQTYETDNGRFALTVGAVVGYRVAPILPLVVPSVRFNPTEQAGLRLSYIHNPLRGAPSGLHLSAEWSF